MKENWVLHKHNPKLRERISTALGVSTMTAQLFVNRGVTSEAEAESFLRMTLFDLPSPFLLKGMQSAVKRIVKALETGEKIAIYGDYDVDGVTSTSLVSTFLAELGADVVPYSPERLTEGYGVNSEAVRKLSEQGVTLIISGDCGITAWREVEEAKKLGVDFIVTDHHHPPEVLPDAVAVLNPHQPGCQYPGKEITGVGVSFNLAIALRRTLREAGFFKDGEPNLGDYLDLVALGTVADCAQLTNVNRLLVREGLKRMHNPRRPGIAALKEVSGIDGEVSSADIGFRLAPRINAAGRLASATAAVELLTARDMRPARDLAISLDSENSARQEIQAGIFAEALEQALALPGLEGTSALALYSRGWHPGVIGIVASKVVERFSMPAVLIAVDESGMGRGSGRSVEGIDLYAVLERCRGLLEEFGGHPLAAGLVIREENIEPFREALDAAVRELRGKKLETVYIDARLDPGSLTIEQVEEFALLEPYGTGNPEPLFLATAQGVVSSRVLKDKHLALQLRSPKGTYKAIWFNAPLGEALPAEIEFLYTPEINEWKGKRELRLRIIEAG